MKKRQTSKCRTFPVLLFKQVSLHIQCLCKFFDLSINYATVSRSFGVLLYTTIHNTKFPKINSHRIVFRKPIIALNSAG